MFETSSDFLPVTKLLERFEAMTKHYAAVLTHCLGGGLSHAAVEQVCGRIKSTIDRCGITQIVNDLIDYIARQLSLKYDIFHKFMAAGASGGERFSGRDTAQMRKVLSYLFKSASKAEAAKFQALFEGTLAKVELSQIDFTPQLVDAVTVAAADGVPRMTGRAKIIHRPWALSLVLQVATIYETAQSVARLEAMHLPQCYMAAERAMRREFAALPAFKKAVFAQASAIALNMLLDFAEDVQMNRSLRQETVERTTHLLKVPQFFMLPH